MKPFIFQFRECPTSENADLSLLTYDPNLNLSVDVKTGRPAILALQMGTETGTRTHIEEADSDNNRMAQIMGTATITLVNQEATDADRDRLSLQMLLGTSTGSKVYDEQPDSDR